MLSHPPEHKKGSGAPHSDRQATRKTIAAYHKIHSYCGSLALANPRKPFFRLSPIFCLLHLRQVERSEPSPGEALSHFPCFSNHAAVLDATPPAPKTRAPRSDRGDYREGTTQLLCRMLGTVLGTASSFACLKIHLRVCAASLLLRIFVIPLAL